MELWGRGWGDGFLPTVHRKEDRPAELSLVEQKAKAELCYKFEIYQS